MTTYPARARHVKLNAKKAMWWIVVLIVVVVWAVPFLFMIFTSLKSSDEIYGSPAFAPPQQFAWSNYTEALQRVDLVRASWSSAVIALIKVPIGLLISAMAAFAIARLKMPFPRFFLLLFVFGTMVPIQIALAPMFQIIRSLGLLNSMLGVILPYIAFGLPYQVFLLYGFFRAIPLEIDEAARMDGASNFRLFWSIILPLAKPAVAALFVLDFVATWNEYAIALVILQKQETWTIPLALQGFNTAFQRFYGPLNAAIIIAVIPVVILYLLFQRYFVEGITAGAVKG